MSILKTTRLQCKSAEARQQAIAALDSVVDEVTKHAVEQFLVAVPLEDVEETVLYVIEEYITQAAMDSSRYIQAAKHLERLLNGGEVLSSPLETSICPIDIKKTSGPPLSLSSNPAILLVGMEYNPGTSSNAVAGWVGMATGAIESVPGVNVFTVAEDKAANTVRMIEVLDSWESLSVLVKTDAAKKNIEHNGKDRTGVKSAIKVRAVAGFVGRV